MTEYNFEQRRAERAQARADRRSNLARLIDSQVTIRETTSIRRYIDWSLERDPAGDRVMACHSGSTPHRAFWGGGVNTAAYLAEHLENRSFGFGWSLAAYCVTCGENLIPDTAVDADPICAACLARLDEERNEQNAEDTYERNLSRRWGNG